VCTSVTMARVPATTNAAEMAVKSHLAEGFMPAALAGGVCIATQIRPRGA